MAMVKYHLLVSSIQRSGHDLTPIMMEEPSPHAGMALYKKADEETNAAAPEFLLAKAPYVVEPSLIGMANTYVLAPKERSIIGDFAVTVEVWAHPNWTTE